MTRTAELLAAKSIRNPISDRGRQLLAGANRGQEHKQLWGELLELAGCVMAEGSDELIASSEASAHDRLDREQPLPAPCGSGLSSSTPPDSRSAARPRRSTPSSWS